MVHTFEIIREVDTREIGLLMTSFNSFRASHRSFPDFSKRISIKKYYISKNNPEYGIKCLILMCIVIRRNNTTRAHYFAVMRIEPQIMITGNRTVSLFYCSNEKINLLLNRFNEIMSGIVSQDNTCLTHLRCWNCRRIDYAANFRFDTQAQVDLFIDTTKKTSRYVRKKIKRVRGIPIRQQSTAEGNGSTKTIIYDKKKQIEKKYRKIKT